MALNDRAMYRTASYIQNRSHRATMPGVVAVIAAFIFTVIFNYFINIYLVNPILRITQGIKRFLETKEPVIVELDTKDELRELLSSIEDMAASLSADKK
jgi:methyl-accepting chemotaxis protein